MASEQIKEAIKKAEEEMEELNKTAPPQNVIDDMIDLHCSCGFKPKWLMKTIAVGDRLKHLNIMLELSSSFPWLSYAMLDEEAKLHDAKMKQQQKSDAFMVWYVNTTSRMW